MVTAGHNGINCVLRPGPAFCRRQYRLPFVEDAITEPPDRPDRKGTFDCSGCSYAGLKIDD